MTDSTTEESLGRRFFGRRLSKPLSPTKKDLLASAIGEISLDMYLEEIIDIPSLFSFSYDNIILEIGFGGGEHLLYQAKTFPNNAYIGCDAYLTGHARLVRQIKEENIHNIRLVNGDALHLLKKIPVNIFDMIYLLYPDPWHKKKHHKRRFIQKDTVDLLSNSLKKEGKFRFASDITGYIAWVFAHMLRHDGFSFHYSHPYTRPFDPWISTKYEKKALREGRYAHYFEFIKKE